MTSIGEQVIANFLSYGVAITIFWFLAKKYFGNFEERIKKNDDRADEIEDNYIDRFDRVNKKLDDNKEYLSKKLDDLQRDKVDFRMKQVEKMATIENKVDNLTDEIRRNHKP